MWHCVYKFPFDYYALYDKKGRLIKTEFPENYYILTQMRGPNDTIKK